MAGYQSARTQMVECQVRTCDVTDHAILDALLTVPREHFVPPAMKALAYLDRDLCIKPASNAAPARFLMQAASFARMAQLAEIGPGDTVLYVGAGNGYGAAVLGRVAKSVVALESEADLAGEAQRLLAAEGAANVTVRRGALELGCPGDAPFDVILFGGSVEFLPGALCDQLADGGRMISVLGQGGAAVVTLTISEGGELSSRAAFNAAVEKLPGFERKREFVF